MARAATRGLPYRNWPDVDRDLWKRLTFSDGPFDVGGALSHLRPASLNTLQNAYGFFLKHVFDTGVDLTQVAPPDRASLDVLKSYLASLDGLAARTRFGYFSALYQVLAKGYPERDWSRLQSATGRLAYRAVHSGTRRDRASTPLTPDLIRLAHDLEAVGAQNDQPCRQAEALRDSLMVQLLAYHPLRLKNFAELEIGTSIIALGDQFLISIPACQMKANRPLTFTLSTALSAKIRTYIETVRPRFPGGENRSAGRLWLRFTYGVWEKAAIGRHISRLTERGLGNRITPHLFRHVAATTIAVTEGADAGVIRPLLGHVSDLTAQRYYILAGQIEAAKLYHKTLREIKKQEKLGATLP